MLNGLGDQIFCLPLLRNRKCAKLSFCIMIKYFEEETEEAEANVLLLWHNTIVSFCIMLIELNYCLNGLFAVEVKVVSLSCLQNLLRGIRWSGTLKRLHVRNYEYYKCFWVVHNRLRSKSSIIGDLIHFFRQQTFVVIVFQHCDDAILFIVFTRILSVLLFAVYFAFF